MATAGALEGVTVADFTQGIDGPFCTKLLADFGADVIKIEPPEGDPLRRLGPFPGGEAHPDRGAAFVYLNANKRGMVLDLATGRGRDLARAVASRASIVVENSPPGAMAARGLGFDDLIRLGDPPGDGDPGTVYVSLTPFGQDGPYASWRAPDIVRQAMCGWMAHGGDPDREPLRSGGDLALYLSGVCAAAASLIGLFHARATGEGQYIDVSAFEALITCSGQDVYRSGMDGDAARTRRSGRRGLPFTIVPARDGWVGVNPLFDRNYADLCEMAGLTELLEDDRYDRIGALRDGRAVEVAERIAAWTVLHGALDLVEAAQGRRLAFAPVPDMEGVLRLPPHVARCYLHPVEDPATPPYVQPGPPFRMSETPWSWRFRAPTLEPPGSGVPAGPAD